MFDDPQALDHRYEYLSGFANDNLIGGYYLWKVPNAVVRVGFALTPAEADDYYNALVMMYGKVEEYAGS